MESELVAVHGSPHFSLPPDFCHGLLGAVWPVPTRANQGAALTNFYPRQ